MPATANGAMHRVARTCFLGPRLSCRPDQHVLKAADPLRSAGLRYLIFLRNLEFRHSCPEKGKIIQPGATPWVVNTAPVQALKGRHDTCGKTRFWRPFRASVFGLARLACIEDGMITFQKLSKSTQIRP